MTVELKTVAITPLRHTFTHVAALIGGDKPATRYQEAVLGAQPDTNFHYRPTWDPDHELFDRKRTAIVMREWNAFKDPRQLYYGTWTMGRARQQDAMESNFEFVEDRGLVARLPHEVAERALDVLLPLRHAAWAANMNNSAICAYGYGAPLTSAAMFHAMDHLGIAQYLTRLGLALSDPARIAEAKQAWMAAPAWQPLRRLTEDTLVVSDWFELFVAQDFVIDGLLYPLVYGVVVDDVLAAKGGTAIAMLTAFMTEWHADSAKWVDAQIKVAAAESDANRALLAGWVRAWRGRAVEALSPVAALALDAEASGYMAGVIEAFDARCAKLGVIGPVA